MQFELAWQYPVWLGCLKSSEPNKHSPILSLCENAPFLTATYIRLSVFA
jgi:hypothetical protein